MKQCFLDEKQNEFSEKIKSFFQSSRVKKKVFSGGLFSLLRVDYLLSEMNSLSEKYKGLLRQMKNKRPPREKQDELSKKSKRHYQEGYLRRKTLSVHDIFLDKSKTLF